jgi:vitamin B12 transporter
MDSKNNLVLLFLLFSFFSIVNAQDFTIQKTDTAGLYRLSEVVISATKTATPKIDVASSVSVIDSAQIAGSSGADFLDLLKNQYGLAITQSGGPGQLAGVYLRGAAADQVLIEIDGVKMNMPDEVNNSYDFSFIPLDNIQRIEVLRGPQSTLYGSDAMSGVINIITKKGSGRPNYFLNLEGGSFNTYKGLIGLNGSYEKTEYSLTLSKTKSGGVSSADKNLAGNTEADGYDTYNISSRLALSINENVNLNFFARFNKGNIDLDQAGGAFGDDPTYKYKHEQGAYRAETNINIFNSMWEQKLGFSFMRNLRTYNYDSTLFNPTSSSSSYQGNSFQIDWQNNLKFIPGHLVTFGVEANKQNMSSSYWYNSSFYGYYISEFPKQNLNTFSAYLQDQLNIADVSFTTGGIRYDKQSKFGSDFTFRITQAYLIKNTGTKIKAAYGSGFKAPSLFNLYDPMYGNPDLKSEKSSGWEIGSEQYFFDYIILLGINYFNNKFTNLFGSDINFRTINVAKAASDGIEVYLDGKINSIFNLNANYTYTNTVDKSPGNEENLPSIIRRPKHKASLKLNYTFLESADASLSINYTGNRYDEDFSFFPAEKVELSNYTLIDLSASYRLTNYILVYGIVKNLTDKKYEEVYGYGTLGCAGYLGIKFNFK